MLSYYRCEKDGGLMAGKSGKSSAVRGAAGDIENIELQSMLFDFYGSLLNDSQNEVMALYHEDNLSLSEIAEELGQSRQAVHYTLKKAEKALNGYEDKLGLVAGYNRNRELAGRAKTIIGSASDRLGDAVRKELISIIDELSE